MDRKYYCNIFEKDVRASDCFSTCNEAKQKWCRRRDFHEYFSTSEIRYANDDSVNLVGRDVDIYVPVAKIIPPADRFLTVDGIVEIMKSDYRRALFNSLSIHGFDYSVSGKRPVVCDVYTNIPKESHLFPDVIYTTNGSHRAMMCNILRVESIQVTLNTWDMSAAGDDIKTERFFDSNNMNKIYRKVRRNLGIVNGVLPFDIENVPKRKAWDIWIHGVNDETKRRLGNG